MKVLPTQNTNRAKYISRLYDNSRRLLSAIDNKYKDFTGDIESTAAREYKIYLEERRKNPMMTAIIMNETLNQNPIKNNDTIMNLISLKKYPEIDTLQKKDDYFYNKHHKTARIRSSILDDGRINANFVTKKLSGLDKFQYKCKLFFRNLKTFF